MGERDEEYVCELYPFQTGAEVKEVREEIIRCRDCELSREKGWKCARWVTGRWDEAQEADVIELADVQPDGFCFKAERREA